MARLRGKVDETQQSVSIDVPRRRKRQRGWRDKVALVDLGIMTKLEATALEYRVLFAVMNAIPEKGGIHAAITIAEIAEQIESSAPSVARSLKQLQERRLIMREGTRVGRLVVNPYLMFNGDFDSWAVETDGYEEPVWKRGVDTATGEVR